ncbi:unnamed protein product, partial [Prorocentrum cordatum]
MAQSSQPSASMCHGSVPEAKAEAMARWAHQRLEWPPPDEAHLSLELRCGDGFGVHAVARQGFEPGDLVLSERALLNIPEVPAQLRQELQRQFGQLASFLEPAVAVDWSRVDEDVRQAALSLFFIHPLFSSQDSKMVLKNTSACEALLGFYSPLQEHWSSVRELMNFLHVVDLNMSGGEAAQACARRRGPVGVSWARGFERRIAKKQ